MISEDEIDEIVERARTLGTDYTVLADILRLIAEVRRLLAPVEAARRLNVERLRLREADRVATEQRVKLVEAEGELESALEKAFSDQPSPAAADVVERLTERKGGDCFPRMKGSDVRSYDRVMDVIMRGPSRT